MRGLFDYPKKAHFGRMVAKGKIYDRAKPSRKIQENFVTQIAKITWAYKLAPETINLTARPGVQEIEIFELMLKGDDLDHNILKSIDKAIVHPIIFHVIKGQQIKVMATYKRPSEADSHKWVIGEMYLASDWMPLDADKQPLPIALDMANLYERLLREILPIDAREDEELLNQIERFEKILSKENEQKRLESRIDKEKQFNRKVEVNAKLRMLASDIQKLKGVE